MSRRPCLVIPIETKTRELDAKTLLACSAAESGFRVYLGEQNALQRRLALIPQGFYLDKSIARLKAKSFQRLRTLGFRILGSCEEGLVYRNRDAYINEKIIPKAFSLVERMFTWGQVQSQDICCAIPNAHEKLVQTGNPRFDLLRPEFREIYKPLADALRDKFGPYIIVNTNFARYNHLYGRDGLKAILKDRGLFDNEQEKYFYEGWIDFVGSVFHSFEDMLPKLARAFPNITIILRAHPSENHDVWRRIADKLANVKVISEGQVIAWILGAKLSIHNSCTTGVEAALLNQPVFTYRTVESKTYDSFLPNRVSTHAGTFEELVHGIEDVLSGRYRSPMELNSEVRDDVENYVCSLSGPLATDRMVESICKLLSTSQGEEGSRLGVRVCDQFKQSIKGVARPVLEPIRGKSRYARQKFPSLSINEVINVVREYQSLTGRFTNISIRPWRHWSVIVESI